MVYVKKFPNGRLPRDVTFYKLFWVFVIGGLIGFVHENIWTVIKFGEPHLRKGLIYGPFLPVYGMGAVFFVLLLHRTKKISRIFFLGSLLGALIEFILSVVQQCVFSSVSWNYSSYPLNIGGRTNLIYAAFWGLLCVLLVKGIYPRISMAVDKLPELSGKVLTFVLAFFIFADCGISALAVFRMGQRNNRVEASNKIEIFLDRHYPDTVLQSIFNNLEFTEHRVRFGIDNTGI